MAGRLQAAPGGWREAVLFADSLQTKLTCTTQPRTAPNTRQLYRQTTSDRSCTVRLKTKYRVHIHFDMLEHVACLNLSASNRITLPDTWQIRILIIFSQFAAID